MAAKKKTNSKWAWFYANEWDGTFGEADLFDTQEEATEAAVENYTCGAYNKEEDGDYYVVCEIKPVRKLTPPSVVGLENEAW